MISEMRMPPLDINGEFYATISSGSRRTHEPSTRTAFVANRTYRRPPISAAIGPLPEVTPLDDRSLSYRKIYGSQTSGGSKSTSSWQARDKCGVNVAAVLGVLILLQFGVVRSQFNLLFAGWSFAFRRRSYSCLDLVALSATVRGHHHFVPRPTGPLPAVNIP